MKKNYTGLTNNNEQYEKSHNEIEKYLHEVLHCKNLNSLQRNYI